MTAILRLNRGSYGTLDLNETLEEGLHLRQGWTPRVAKRRRSPFGGKPFERVEESLPLRAESITDGDTVLRLVQRLVEALEQAYAWRMGAEVDPVLLEYLPTESGLSDVMQTVVWGTPDGAQDLLALQPGFDEHLNTWFVEFDLPLVRDGLWLDEEEAATPESGVNNPGAMTVSFTNDARLPSPVDLAFTESPTHVNANAKGFILTADQSDKIALVEAENIATAGGWTTQAGNASGGSYKRYTGTTQSLVTVSSSISFNAQTRLFAVFANIRNSSTNYSYAVQATLLTGSGHNSSATRPVIIPKSANTAEVYFLGICALPAPVEALNLTVTPNGSGSANNGLEIDYFVIQAIDDYTRAVAFGTTAVFQDLTLETGWLTRLMPRVYANDGTDTKYLDYSGDANFLSIGTELTAWILGTPGDTTNFYLVHQLTGATRLAFVLNATRRLAYVTPR